MKLHPVVVASAPELAAALSRPIVAPPSQGLDAAALGLDQFPDAPLLIEEEKKKQKKESKTKSKAKSPKAKKKPHTVTSPSEKEKETGELEVSCSYVDYFSN